MSAKCARCSAYKNEYNINCVPFSGNPNADVYFLGEMAGREEAQASREKPSHFIGKAGYKFDELLTFPKLKRENIAIANVLRCYKKGNLKPTKKEMDACFPFTWQDVQNIKPKLVVAMGGSALYQLTGREGVELHRGKLLWSGKVQAKIYIVFHPASCLYDDSKWKILVEDFKKIPSLLEQKPPKIKHYPYIHITKIEQFQEMVFKCDFRNKEISLDLETTGLDPYYDEITLLQINNGEKIVVIEGELLPHLKDELKVIFSENYITGQDFSFDAKFLKVKLDIDIDKWEHDCCLAEYCLTGMKDNDLDFLVGNYVPESFGYSDEVKQAGGAHKIRDKKKLLQYAADDVGVLPIIKRKQYKRLIKEKKLWFFENMMMPTNKVLTNMSLRGAKYDIKKVKEFDKEYENKAKEALVKGLKLEGVKACEQHFKQIFNPRSSAMIKWMLLDYYKLPILSKTKKGNPSIQSDEMERYAKDFNNPYCQAMEKYRSYQSIRDNFLSGVLPKLQDGIAHTRYSLHAAASSRPASSNPNLQNLPSDIRSIIIPREGCVFLHADLSQIEVKIAAAIYNDEELIRIVNREGSDFHCMVAAKINKISYEIFYKKYKEGDDKYIRMRYNAKEVTFGILYQETAFGLAKALNISEAKAQKFIDEYFEDFPQLYKNIERTKQFVIRNGYIRNPFGFERRWKHHPEKDLQTLRECVNQPIQSTAWNLMELILIKVDKLLTEKEGVLILQTYDDLIIELPKDEVSETAEEVKKIIENINKPFKGLNRVNIKADFEVGNNLGDLKKI